jgi:hypothetical protein
LLSLREGDSRKQDGRAEQEKYRKQGSDILLTIDVKERVCKGKNPVHIVMPANVLEQLPPALIATKRNGTAPIVQAIWEGRILIVAMDMLLFASLLFMKRRLTRRRFIYLSRP